MRHTQHLRVEVRDRLGQLAAQMRDWQESPAISDEERGRILKSIQPFRHTTMAEPFRLAGVDGSGDYPSLTYADSFIYITVAQGTLYQVDSTSGLREISPQVSPPPEFTWLPDDEIKCREEWERAFVRLVGLPIREVVERSDYRNLKALASGRTTPVDRLSTELICPHASDSGNIGIQLRTAAEMSLALKLIQSEPRPRFVLVDTTFSLPMVSAKNTSLFYEHVKRLCCVEARQRGIGFFAVSKSHGLPAMELIEDFARDKMGFGRGTQAEHWYMRIPTKDHDGWELALTKDRQLPPIGAVTYLVRFHRNVPVLRLDMDVEFWRARVLRDDEQETLANESWIFEHLDYASHDQRSFGYPYPLKAGHDRASLTQTERSSFRRQIIDAAVSAGMKRSVFRDASMATGHK